MKKAIGYIRISDKDQSNFSIEGQERYIRKWAEKNQVELISIFVDDGKSARNFDRPDWKKLEAVLKENYRDIDYLLFIKYDRFSRNLLQALTAIQKLEVKYNIMLEAVLEPINLPRDHPDYFRQRTQYLFDAENEWHRIRSRTKDGINQAQISGRYIHKAPFGYKNLRDEQDKPIIEIDMDKASIITHIFNQYLNNVPIQNIAQEAQKMGLTVKGHSAITRILSNCVYSGLIHVKGYRDEPERLVQGLHTGIIDQTTWREVQYRLGNIKRPRQIMNDEAPLRGVLLCGCCGNYLTGAKSRGKTKWYWYYKCNHHSGNNHSAEKLHAQLWEVFDGFSLSPKYANYLITKARSEMESHLQEQTVELKTKKSELKKQQDALNSLEEKFILNQINHETYNKWHSTYTHNIYILNQDMAGLQSDHSGIMELFETELPKLTDLNYCFNKANLVQKQMLIRLVFDSKLSYAKDRYRTPYILPIFEPNYLSIKENSPLIFDQQAEKPGKIPSVAPAGIEPTSKV